VTDPSPRGRRHVDISLSALLGLQALTLFVAVPLGAAFPSTRFLLDTCRLTFAIMSVAVLARHRAIQAILLASVAVLAAGPVLGGRLMVHLGFGSNAGHDVISLTAFAFIGAVTILVARHVFGPGRVTVHRVRGAILMYLNVAALFAIAYGEIETFLPGAIAPAGGGHLPTSLGLRAATLTYFSLSTITTTGFGDLAPVHPIARSLANFESVFGQLFPATLLARLVAIQLAHDDTPAHATLRPPGMAGADNPAPASRHAGRRA